MLDLMLREHVREGGNFKEKPSEELAPEYLESLVTK
jgi:hypothetical protein